MDDNSNRVRFRTLDWAEICRKTWGKEWNEKEVVYEFSNKREFKSTDHTNSGIYEHDE